MRLRTVTTTPWIVHIFLAFMFACCWSCCVWRGPHRYGCVLKGLVPSKLVSNAPGVSRCKTMWSVAGVLSHLGPNSTGAMYWTLARVPKPAPVGFLLPPLDLGSPAEVTRARVSFCSPKWLLNSLFSFNCIQQQAWGLKNSCMFCENTRLIRRVKSFCLGKGLSVCSLDTRERTWKSPGQSYPVTATRKTAHETQIQGTARFSALGTAFLSLFLSSLNVSCVRSVGCCVSGCCDVECYHGTLAWHQNVKRESLCCWEVPIFPQYL